MPRITLVRHGQAAAGWGDDLDPGLSEVGRSQAVATADALVATGPLPSVTSPLRRCRETAAPLAQRWGTEALVAPPVGEIPSPAPSATGDDTAALAARSAWLRAAMQGRWTDLGAEHATWRAGVLEAVAALGTDTVVFSHFIAINVVVGAALGDDRVVCFAPDNCSWTIVDVEDGRVSIVELGRQATTEVR